MMKDTQKLIAVSLSALALLVFSIAGRAYLAHLYWGWFAVPNGAPDLPWQVLFAAVTFVGFLTHSPKRKSDEPTITELWGTALIVYVLTWAYGYAMYLWLGGAA